jgi:hypothetical protein
MIAETPEMVAVMKELGLPASHVERARFSEFRPLERLVLAPQLHNSAARHRLREFGGKKP